MTNEEKQQLAKELLSEIAWDLTQARIYEFQPNESASTEIGEMFINQIILELRAKIHRGKSVAVVIIPEKR
jgi:precorrin-2 methylase